MGKEEGWQLICWTGRLVLEQDVRVHIIMEESTTTVGNAGMCYLNIKYIELRLTSDSTVIH